MKLSKDQIIKGLIGLVVVLIVVVAVQMIKSDDSDKEEDNGEDAAMEEGAVEGATEGTTEETTEGTAAKPQTKPQAKPTAAPAPKPTSTTSSYTGGTCSPSLTAYKDSAFSAILLSWTTCQNEDFQYYKIVKSSINPNPSYPGDPVVVSSSNRSTANFIDKTVSPRTTFYYRACAVQKINKFTCGNIVSVTY